VAGKVIDANSNSDTVAFTLAVDNDDASRRSQHRFRTLGLGQQIGRRRLEAGPATLAREYPQHHLVGPSEEVPAER
jgi:hypothetical protein